MFSGMLYCTRGWQHENQENILRDIMVFAMTLRRVSKRLTQGHMER